MDALESASSSLQLRALQSYLVWSALREDWSKRLVLLADSAQSGTVALGAKAAGAVVLLIAQDPKYLREANQAGITDFSVNSLSETIRILKNEIRKGLPISVGLLDVQESAWDEAVERGLQPEAFFAGSGISTDAVAVLLKRGAVQIDADLRTGENAFESLRTEHAQNWRDRIAKDAALLIDFEHLPTPERVPAVRWLHAASRLFPRDLHRCYAKAWTASNGGV